MPRTAKKTASNDYRIGEILLIAIIAGGLSGGVAALLRFEFDPDATFAFFGAIIGAAVAVGLSIAFEGWHARRVSDRARAAVQSYLDAMRSQYDGDLGILSDPTKNAGEKIACCVFLVSKARNDLMCLSEALEVDQHLGFWSRAWLRNLLGTLEHLRAEADKAVQAADDPCGDFDSGPLQAAIRQTLNGMALIETGIKHPIGRA